MSRRRLAARLLFFVCTAVVLMTKLSGSERSGIVVSTTAELLAALATGPGETIFLQRGTYQLDHALQVPDNTTLIGEGEMLFDASGLPSGFLSDTRSVIAAGPGVTGDFVSLGDSASLQGLVIQDRVRPTLTGGGVVVVASREPGDSVSVRVLSCEIISPNAVGTSPTGPAGRALIVTTLNPHFSTGLPSHEGSRLSVDLVQSIIRSPAGGGSVFFNNFASLSRIELQLRQNVLGGPFTGAAGVSRPESTIGSSVWLQSNGNLYRSDVPATATLPGWNLQGAADAPASGISAPTLHNSLWVHSVDDRIEGWGRTIIATGGQRNSALSAPVSSNQTHLILQGTRLQSITSDLLFRGATSLAAGVPPGDFNETHVTLRGVIGSGLRTNDYIHSTANMGIGNQLVIVGSLNAFLRSNEAILPAPGPQFFTAER